MLFSQERRTPELSDSAQPSHDVVLPQEISFLKNYGADAASLAPFVFQAKRMGTTTDHVMLATGALAPERFYQALANHLGAPYGIAVPALPEDADLPTIIKSGVVPLADNAQGLRFCFAPRGALIGDLMQLVARGRGVRPAFSITTPQNLANAVRKVKGNHIAQSASQNLDRLYPNFSASNPLSWQQTTLIALSVIYISLSAIFQPALLEASVFVSFGLVFLIALATRLAATFASTKPHVMSHLIAQSQLLSEEALPQYSIIVPLYREARIVPNLIGALNALDYPPTRLDIKLVVEEGDYETLRAIEAQTLTANYDIIIAPKGAPQTKPRALNIALPFVTGMFTTIYDAEDMPEPSQLRLAVTKFLSSPQTTGCLQAKLLIDNTHDSWLTSLFTLEYAALFDVINPGLAALRLPILLGGTSNHFRTSCLRDIAGWDAWNVTEDADLGMRLARLGYDVEALHATTHEEAPSTLKGWLAQRRRWLKGWMQTILTHSRQPIRTIREMGLMPAIATLSILAGTLLGALFAPLFLTLLGLRLYDGSLLAPQTLADTLYSGWALTIGTLGLVAIGWPAFLGLYRRGLMHLWGAIFLMPLYYCLLTLAAWQALFSLIHAPYYWDKTTHGLAKTSRVRGMRKR